MANEVQPSFASPYSLSSLEKIPAPVLKLLVQMGPLLRGLRVATDILQWTHSRQSLLALLLWVSVCLWTWECLALGVPAVFLFKLQRDWLRVRILRTRRQRLEQQRMLMREKMRREGNDDEDTDEDDTDDRWNAQRRQQQHEMEQEELIARKIQPNDYLSLDDTLQDITQINNYVARILALHRSLLPWIDGSRQDVLIAVLAALLYLVPLWIITVFVLGANGALALIGAAAILADSPWSKVIAWVFVKNTLVRYTAISFWSYGVAVISSYSYFLMPSETHPANAKSRVKSWFGLIRRRAKDERHNALQSLRATDIPHVRSEMLFQFEIFENQRWWLGANWTTNMLSTERAPWTDNHLTPISSKAQFVLPEPASESGPDGQVTIKTWTWADGDWWVDMTGELDARVDLNGWEYSNNAWQNPSGVPGMQTFTRRRRWCRRARLVQKHQKDTKTATSPSSSPASTTTSNANGKQQDANLPIRKRK
ncbi:Peroxin/Dysferlin domain-containing protein [Gongronella butleri]|nr:Peroxin/Dysferlin domain-containing protein [Gongronella butleri]